MERIFFPLLTVFLVVIPVSILFGIYYVHQNLVRQCSVLRLVTGAAAYVTGTRPKELGDILVARKQLQEGPIMYDI